MNKRPWTAEDVAKLKSMARRYPTIQIANELGRGLSATVMMAHTLGISLRLKPKREVVWLICAQIEAAAVTTVQAIPSRTWNPSGIS